MREVLIEAVEERFGAVEAVPAEHRLEFLTDNGGAYIAADTRAMARSLGLSPINTPVCSPQSIGMAESFVNTFKRDTWLAWTYVMRPTPRHQASMSAHPRIPTSRSRSLEATSVRQRLPADQCASALETGSAGGPT